MRKTTQNLSCIKYKLLSDLSWIIIQKFLAFSQPLKPGISFTFALDIWSNPREAVLHFFKIYFIVFY